MTPALALFYGGMVRRKNILSTLTLSYAFMALIGVQWVLYGYSLAFGTDIKGIIGGLNFLGFRGVDASPDGVYSATIPQSLFAAFQMMFAIITPALITGAFVERVKFKSFIIFSLLWATVIYDPPLPLGLGNGGWLRKLAFWISRRDGGAYRRRFLRPCLCSGCRPRRGYGRFPWNPITFSTILGPGCCGSAVRVQCRERPGRGRRCGECHSDHQHIRATAGLVWNDAFLTGRPPSTWESPRGLSSGAAVTPASGFITPWRHGGGCDCRTLSYYAMRYRERRKLDESLDVWACHGIASIWGMIATGLFATTAVNSAGADGLFAGNPGQIGVQLLAVIVTIAFTFGGTYIIARILHASVGLRVTALEEEVPGHHSHGERAY
jgi:Amt family ammonium transporter